MTTSSNQNFNFSARKRALLETLLNEENLGRSGAIKIARRQEDAPARLSFAQERLWFLDQFQPGLPIYNMPVGLPLKGPMDVSAVERAVNEILCRHEVLRTRFCVDNDQPVQIVNATVPISLPVIDLRERPAETRESEVQHLLAKEWQHLFDLSEGPLFRASLVCLDDMEHVLLLNMHHIVSDGWSLGLLLKEFGALYEAYAAGRDSPLAELPIQYADFADWQREYLSGPVLDEHLAYWQAQLAGAPPVLELPTDRPRPAVQTFRGGAQTFKVPKNVAQGLAALSREAGVTPFMTLLAAFKALICRYTGQGDVVVGTPIATRNRAEIEGLIGFFVNTLVLRTQLGDDPSFRELLGRVREVTLSAYAHQDLPFEKLVQELQPERALTHTPLFQVMFALQNTPTTQDRAFQAPPGRSESSEPVGTSTAKFDLSLFMKEEQHGLDGEIEYNTDLFDHQTIKRMLGHWQTLLAGIAAAPDRRLSEFALLIPEERERLLAQWSAREVPLPEAACVHELFEAQVKRTAESVAVVFDGDRVTYGELDRRANRLANYLRTLGVGPEARVGVCLERSVQMVVAVLGILKVGGAYVPLDPAYPRDRLTFMLEDAEVAVLLSEERLAARLQGHAATVISLETAGADIARESATRFACEAKADNLAYVIYTSGSTGRPKGVAMPHRALVNLIQVHAQDSLPEGEATTLQFAPLSFDVSFQELFATLCWGGTLTLLPEGHRRNPEALLRYLKQSGVRRLFLPPVALQQLAEAADTTKDVFPLPLREIITAGDQLRITSAVASFFSQLPGIMLRNQYGPTETHVATQWVLTGAPEEWPMLPPIGRPIDNTEIRIVDRYLQLVPVGVPGELCIGGISLARAYLNRPGLTAERFVPNPFARTPGGRLYRTGDLARYRDDGTIEFLGRIDHQLKIRGHRIEPGEVEAVLNEHAQVAQVVVAARDVGSGPKQLVGYFVPEAGRTPDVSDLRRFAQERLPDFMIPGAFVSLEALPLSPNGKVDRRALPTPDGVRPHFGEELVAPRNDVEARLATIWREVLRLDGLGIHDDFFEVGGHSLLATQIVSRMRDAFHLDFPLRLMFETPTICELAAAVVRAQATEPYALACAHAPQEAEQHLTVEQTS